MNNRWSEVEAAEFVSRYGDRWGEDLALRTYSSRLLGAEKGLVLHGGGNSSVKGTHTHLFGEVVSALYVKASGHDMATIQPEGHPGLDLSYLLKLRHLEDLSDPQMVNEFRAHLFDHQSATPSIETLAHAFLPKKYIDHSHADAVLALTNQRDGRKVAEDVFGQDVILLEYVKPGFKLAKAAAAAFEAHPAARAMVWMHHGLVTWGQSAREAYEAMIEWVSRAEDYVAAHRLRPLQISVPTPLPVAEERLIKVAPALRGILSPRTQDPDHPYQKRVLQPLVTTEVLNFVDSDRGKELALSSPLTSDHLIRTKAVPLWIDSPAYEDRARLRDQLTQAVANYSKDYSDYIRRQAAKRQLTLPQFDPFPRVILMPGLGAICVGKDPIAAHIARDITIQTLAVKAQVAAMGTYQGLSEEDLFSMEYDRFQQAKLELRESRPLNGQIALVTGAAGAIGSGISRALLQQGCAVAVADLPGDNLNRLVQEFQAEFPQLVIGIPFDVTDPAQVRQGFTRIITAWGGLDLVVANAGIALVASLATMDLMAFRKLEQINVEGTLLILAEAARLFADQGIGGDIVLVSTKNVFAPGAKFGAYSATKAAAHQLARIASLELAEMGVRVNMVAPDAVFGEGTRKSGLWATVGPDRMRARGLDEKGLEEYYRSRNLLKARITAQHVANAVLYFATRQTPTTGATIPVDGGLPDATPR